MPSFFRLLAPLAASVLLAPAAAAAGDTASTTTANKPIVTTGAFEVDIVFPRNQTYAPSPHMPIVFAIQNPDLAHLLNPAISFDVWSSRTNMSKNHGDMWYIGARNSSHGPFVYQAYADYAAEDHWALNWRLEWESCFVADRGFGAVMTNSTGGRVEFTTAAGAAGAMELDLVAALQDGDSCQASTQRAPRGVAVQVTGAMPNPWSPMPNSCGIVAPSLPDPSPCDITVDAAAATSIAAQVTADVCLATDTSKGCVPAIPTSSGAQSMTVGGVVGLATAVGACGLATILGLF